MIDLNFIQEGQVLHRFFFFCSRHLPLLDYVQFLKGKKTGYTTPLVQVPLSQPEQSGNGNQLGALIHHHWLRCFGECGRLQHAPDLLGRMRRVIGTGSL